MPINNMLILGKYSFQRYFSRYKMFGICWPTLHFFVNVKKAAFPYIRQRSCQMKHLDKKIQIYKYLKKLQSPNRKECYQPEV